MERMLEKLAHQLNSLDEASLMALWGRFAARVERFEPTRRWEEAALCLCMCQAVRWKNQLFNHHFAASVAPGAHPPKESTPEAPQGLQGPDPFQFHLTPGTGKKQTAPPPGKVLAFGKKDGSKTPENEP